MITGFLNLWKPPRGSSARLVAAVKRVTGEKTGHMGTLDPMAEGVLPVCLGRAGRLFDDLIGKEKLYTAEFTFGRETDTLDGTGETVRETEIVPTERDILAAIPSLVGEIDQVPPRYSAKSVGGVRGYRLARRGEEFELPAKRVTVLSVDLLGGGGNVWRFAIRCKGGTYIRSICRDLAYRCGSLGTMTALVREAAGPFVRANAVTEETLAAGNWRDCLIPADSALGYPKIAVTAGEAARLLEGKRVAANAPDGLVRVYAPGEFFGVGRAEGGSLAMRSYLRTDIYEGI